MKSTIKNLPILDLREVPNEDINKIGLVENVRTVILSKSNFDSFIEVKRKNVRSHLIIEEDEVLVIGQIEFNNEFLSEIQANNKLVLLGHALVDEFDIDIFNKTIKSVRIYGQIFYSNNRCVGALMARLERLQGQMIQMQPSAVRLIGETNLDLKLLYELKSKSIASIGPINIHEEVSPKQIAENIESIAQVGEIRGSEDSVCALMSLCRTHLGPVKVL